eukprot:PITA_05318
MDVEPKIAKTRDYWDGPMVDKVTELLCEYQYLFPTKFTDLNGIIRYLGVMKIPLKPDVKPVKQRLYRLNPKYKEKIRVELDKMLTIGIIEPVEEFDWVPCSEPALMLDTCQRYQIALNLKKCTFLIPFGNLLGHVVCRQDLMVDPMNIAMIINLEASWSVKQLCDTLGHTEYYKKFIKSYAQITVLMEKLLKKDVTFYWNDECKKILDVFKEKMVTTLILVFPNWKK